MLNELSNQMADAVASAAPSVVQVQGNRRPASGLVYANASVVTTLGALGREDGLHVRRHDGQVLDAELAGWDPTTSLAVLRVAGLDTPPLTPAKTPARVGHLALAIARSWSNAVTASAGIVSVIGGPLQTGSFAIHDRPSLRGRGWHLMRRGGWGRPARSGGGGAIDEIIRTTAPMHDGFAGGAFMDTSGGLLGVATAAAIRGLSVIIPVSIAWKTAADLLEHGRLKRGYLGIAGQPVTLPEGQQGAVGRAEALLIVGVTKESPAAAAGILVGDVLLALDGTAIESPEDLLNLLVGDRVGRPASLHLLRGGTAIDVTITVGERPASE